MSFWDKLKSFFKKKERKEEAKEPQQTALSKALDLAESKLMEKEGEMSASELERFRSRIAALRKNVGADEESALISVSQLIGAIARAKKREAPKEEPPKEKAPEKKEEKPKEKPSEQKAETTLEEAPKEPQQTALSKALDLAESKLMEKEGEMSASELERFRSRIAALRKNVGADEESALISVSQLIGAIARAKKREAPKEKAPEEKKPTDKMKNKKASSKTNKTGKKKTAKKSNK